MASRHRFCRVANRVGEWRKSGLITAVAGPLRQGAGTGPSLALFMDRKEARKCVAALQALSPGILLSSR
jgi:hypothetical protein